MQIRFTRSACHHRIGNGHALHVMEHTAPTASTNARGETEYHWIGRDERGVELEIAAVLIEQDATLLVLHVMPTRFRGGTP